MHSRLKQRQEDNIQLASTVGQQRQEIESLLRGLTCLVADLGNSNASLPHDQMLSLTQENVAIDEEMRADG